MSTTIRYVQENEDLTEDGYRLDQAMSRLVDDAADADYATEGGEVLTDAVESFRELANRHPRSLSDRMDRSRCAAVREIVFTLFAPKSMISEWQMRELKEALATLTKEQIVDALVGYGTAANEFFRMLWLVSEHGGWRKPRREEA